jgi:hypothetical protein
LVIGYAKSIQYSIAPTPATGAYMTTEPAEIQQALSLAERTRFFLCRASKNLLIIRIVQRIIVVLKKYSNDIMERSDSRRTHQKWM